ncbi:MAG: hypothetical protein RLY47_465 [Candidatus Parcubacteria bacterium]|jgi:uncharacterized membrane protein YphA (DoxX/SURF4 family)
MDYRKRGIVITVRTLLGLIFVFSGIGGLLAGNDVSNLPEPMATITTSLWTAGILPLIKATEFVGGLMLLVGFLPALATIILAPVVLGILVVNTILMPLGALIGLVLCLMVAYLGYAYWDKYRALFQEN